MKSSMTQNKNSVEIPANRTEKIENRISGIEDKICE
jgi:hypothetical protein